MFRPLIALHLVLAGSVPPAQTAPGSATQTIKLVERAGVMRTQFPVEVRMPLAKAGLKSPDGVALFRVEGTRRIPVAFQVVSASPLDPAGAGRAEVRLAFLADVAANSTATYEVAPQGSRANPGRVLKVTGEGLGRTIDTGAVAFELHRPSGQLLSFVPKAAAGERLGFVQNGEARPFHWNPDVWAPPATWGHTSDWRTGTLFDPKQHGADRPPAADDKTCPFFYHEDSGPLLYRQTRWGQMPFIPQVDARVTYTFHAGLPLIGVQSRMEFRQGMQLRAVRNAELVFSRHQFDTAVWITKDGKLHTAPCYDYQNKDRSFKEVVKLPPDVPCLGLANERKGYGIALLPLSMKNVNKLTGKPAEEGAHFYIRDYDEHGKGSPNNFHYFVRPLVLRGNYEPTQVSAGSTYEEQSAIVVFSLSNDAAQKYDQLLQWHKVLTNPLDVTVE